MWRERQTCENPGRRGTTACMAETAQGGSQTSHDMKLFSGRLLLRIKAGVLLRPLQTGGAAETRLNTQQSRKETAMARQAKWGPRSASLPKKGRAACGKNSLAAKGRRGGNKARQHPRPGARAVDPLPIERKDVRSQKAAGQNTPGIGHHIQYRRMGSWRSHRTAAQTEHKGPW